MATTTKNSARRKKAVPVAGNAESASLSTVAETQSASSSTSGAPNTSDPADSSGTPDQPSTEPMFREDRIRAAAYRLYLERGGQDGDHLTDWLEAEAEVESEDADPR